MLKCCLSEKNEQFKFNYLMNNPIKLSILSNRWAQETICISNLNNKIWYQDYGLRKWDK